MSESLSNSLLSYMFPEESQNRMVDNLKRKKNTISYKAKIVCVVTEVYNAPEQTSQTMQGVDTLRT